VELLYVPSSTRYSIEGLEHTDSFYHTLAKMSTRSEYKCKEDSFEPLNILEDFQTDLPDIATPNVKGVRWSYPDAIANTLKELEPSLFRASFKMKLTQMIQTYFLNQALRMEPTALVT